MNLFDILGPIMVGPSSSHTAGAAKIGYVTRKLLGETPCVMEMYLHGSFAATGDGHGTDKALVAGVLGMQPDDENIPRSFEIAKHQNLKVKKSTIELRDAHPNTTLIKLTGVSGAKVEVEASSLGGGRICVTGLDGMRTNFTGDYPTLIIRNEDRPGAVARVAGILWDEKVNIATMQLYRDKKGGLAAMVIESDQKISSVTVHTLKQVDGVVMVTYLDLYGE
ncbi:MAG: L-serine ammonia-lyase, iron-sulfur-dependent subunit beta [Massiliimalia sp.]